MTAALGSGGAPLPSLPQPRPRAPRPILVSGPSRFHPPAALQCAPMAADLRPNPRCTGHRYWAQLSLMAGVVAPNAGKEVHTAWSDWYRGPPGQVRYMPLLPISLYLLMSPRISQARYMPSLPISPHIFPNLPISRRRATYALAAYISPYLPISPHISQARYMPSLPISPLHLLAALVQRAVAAARLAKLTLEPLGEAVANRAGHAPERGAELYGIALAHSVRISGRERDGQRLHPAWGCGRAGRTRARQGRNAADPYPSLVIIA